MADPFDTVRFLANSENRVRLLEAIADTPRTRAELQGDTGIPRATLGRILSDLQDRGWIRQDGKHYEATPEGAHLVEEFDALLDTIAALAELGDLVAYLPVEAMPFGLGHFSDATVTRPDTVDSVAPVRRGTAAIRSADRIRSVTGVYAPPAIEAHHEAVSEDTQSCEVVFSAAAIEAMVTDPDVAPLLGDLLDSDTAAFYRYPGDIPYNMAVADETAYLGLSDERGAPQALIETDDSSVCEWVRTTIDGHRDDATRLTADDLPN